MGSPSEQLALRAQPHHEFDLSMANPTCSIQMERRGTKCCNASAIAPHEAYSQGGSSHLDSNSLKRKHTTPIHCQRNESHGDRRTHGGETYMDQAPLIARAVRYMYLCGVTCVAIGWPNQARATQTRRNDPCGGVRRDGCRLVWGERWPRRTRGERAYIYCL